MKKVILLLLLSCFHSAVAIGGTKENLLNFALTAIQNNGKAIARLSDSLDRKLDEIKTELREEIQQVKTDLGKEIQLIRNELGNETLAVKTRLRKESDEIQAQILSLSNRLVGRIEAKSIETLFTEQKDLFEEKIASLNSTISINYDNLASKADSLVSEYRNSTAAIHKVIVENRSSLLTLLPNASHTKPRDQERITIQRRGTPLLEGRAREKFQNRTWSEYENGFGSQDADFWIGLQRMHNLTEAGYRELRVDLEDWEGNKAYASYSLFKIAGASDNYRLTVSGYSGTAGDSMTRSNAAQFSTVERDNVEYDSVNCEVAYGGPWWRRGCTRSSLNFEYQNESKVEFKQGIIWYSWKGYEYSLKKVEMRIRRPATHSN